MIFGQSFSSGFGEPDHALAGLDAEQRGTLIDVILYGRTGFGDSSFGVYVNCQLIQTVWLPDGATSQTISVPAPVGNVSIHAISNGWSQLDQSDIARGLDSETSTSATIQWGWDYDIMPSINTDGSMDTELTDWSITGLTPDSGGLVSQTRRSLNVTLTANDASTGTVTIATGNTTITGSGANPSYITLSDGNGATGTVLMSYTFAVYPYASTKTLVYRYPAFTTVYRNGASVGTANFNGQTNCSYTDANVSPGVYDYTLVNTSDTGAVGTATAPVYVQIEEVPEPVTDLHYYSGTSNATIVEWTPSSTSDIVYNVYLRKVGQTIIDTIEPYTSVAGPSALLTNIGYNGTVEVMVRVQSTVSGLEEANPFILEMEYDAHGNYIPPRPNVVRVTGVRSNGLVATMTVLYPIAGEKGVATKVRMYSDTYARYDKQDLVDNGNGYRTATLTATLSSVDLPAWRTWLARAVTADGTEGSDSQTQKTFMSETAPSPTNIVVTASRG